MALRVKAAYDGTIRRLSVASNDCDGLRAEVVAAFGLPTASAVAFTWLDDEGDAVALTTDADLAEARRVGGDLLRLTLTPVGDEPAAMAETAAPREAAAEGGAAVDDGAAPMEEEGKEGGDGYPCAGACAGVCAGGPCGRAMRGAGGRGGRGGWGGGWGGGRGGG